jgi:DNA-binding FadR family transcriptional regulator
MPIQVIEPRRLYVQIADQIQALIAGGEFPLGSRLPAERELAKRFGVSRPSLREALIALEVQGYVDVRPGSGIVVRTPSSVALDGSGEEGPLEVLRARLLIEGEIAAEAARDMKLKDVATLEGILLTMEREDTEQSVRLASDRQFHRYIAAKLGNKVLLRLVMGLFDQRDTPLARQFATHFDNAKTWTSVAAEHHRIVAAMTTRNPGEARKAMRDHLRKAHNRWAQDLDRDAKAGLSGSQRRVSTDGDGLAPVG